MAEDLFSSCNLLAKTFVIYVQISDFSLTGIWKNPLESFSKFFLQPRSRELK